MQMISETHGGRRKAFGWQLVGKNVVIKNVENREHIYPVSEIFLTIKWLHEKFQMGWFPLANNVELLHRGEERPGRSPGCGIRNKLWRNMFLNF